MLQAPARSAPAAMPAAAMGPASEDTAERVPVSYGYGVWEQAMGYGLWAICYMGYGLWPMAMTIATSRKAVECGMLDQHLFNKHL